MANHFMLLCTGKLSHPHAALLDIGSDAVRCTVLYTNQTYDLLEPAREFF